MIRAAVCTLLLIGASAPLALGENKLVWGYWIQRPTIASSLLGVDEVLGISSLPIGSAPQTALDRASLLKARGRCEPSSNECLEGRLLPALGGREAKAGEVRDSLLREAWAAELKERPLPLPKDPAYQSSARSVTGLGIRFRRGGGEYVALAYRTSEVANDRHIYSEALYRLSGRNLEPVRQERFLYEIAGLEAVDWRVLWPLNLACLVACVTLGGYLWRRLRHV